MKASRLWTKGAGASRAAARWLIVGIAAGVRFALPRPASLGTADGLCMRRLQPGDVLDVLSIGRGISQFNANRRRRDEQSWTRTSCISGSGVSGSGVVVKAGSQSGSPQARTAWRLRLAAMRFDVARRLVTRSEAAGWGRLNPAAKKQLGLPVRQWLHGRGLFPGWARPSRRSELSGAVGAIESSFGRSGGDLRWSIRAKPVDDCF